VVTSDDDGDMRPSPGDRGGPSSLAHCSPASWTFVRQVHGHEVVIVDDDEAAFGALDRTGDALLTISRQTAVAVLGADCALVGLASPEGVIAVAHAGWRGLVGGVLEQTVTAMRSRGAKEIHAILGPCIHAECYEFGDGLDQIVEVFGDDVRSATSSGRPALDLPAGVKIALERCDVVLETTLSDEVGGCTACGGRWYSHRARRDTARHALGLWRAPSFSGGCPTSMADD